MSWSSHIFKVLHRNSTLLPQLSYLLNHFEIYLTLISKNLLRKLARRLSQNVAMHFFKLAKSFQVLFRALHKVFLTTIDFLPLSKVALIFLTIIIWFSSQSYNLRLIPFYGLFEQIYPLFVIVSHTTLFM